MKRMPDRMSSLNGARRVAMAVLARAPADELKRLWYASGLAADVEDIRAPETGLVTVRGRIGGGGASFNLGEATVTRATVRLASGEIGHAYALGRDREKVRLAAALDALWQKPEMRPEVERRVIGPLSERLATDDARRRAETAATRVEFFTMVRGEDK
jgi:alpha-D-ribose 1-methylphosphonate 5-triphosphate synthase subunit PhnG